MPVRVVCTSIVLEQVRSMVWITIAGGAQGVFFYSIYDISKNPGLSPSPCFPASLSPCLPVSLPLSHRHRRQASAEWPSFTDWPTPNAHVSPAGTNWTLERLFFNMARPTHHDGGVAGSTGAVLRAFFPHLRYPLYTHPCVLIAYRVIGMNRYRWHCRRRRIGLDCGTVVSAACAGPCPNRSMATPDCGGGASAAVPVLLCGAAEDGCASLALSHLPPIFSFEF